jgi:hypothetical protein
MIMPAIFCWLTMTRSAKLSVFGLLRPDIGFHRRQRRDACPVGGARPSVVISDLRMPASTACVVRCDTQAAPGASGHILTAHGTIPTLSGDAARRVPVQSSPSTARTFCKRSRRQWRWRNARARARIVGRLACGRHHPRSKMETCFVKAACRRLRRQRADIR